MNPLEETNLLSDDSLDGYEWLELDNIPSHLSNRLMDFNPNKPAEPVDEMLQLLMDRNYLHFACKYVLNYELLPFQLVVLDALWRKRLPMLIGSRGMGKSFILALYAVLRMIFHPGCKIVIVGAAYRQSRQVFEYMVNIWDRSPILRDIAGRGRDAGPKHDVDRCVFTIGTSKCYAIPIGDGTKIRGLRANYILADEFASIPESIFNLVVQGFGVVAAGPDEKVKEYAMINRLKKLGQWTDDMEKLHRSQAGGNQIVYSGTAYYAFNHFYRYFQKWHTIIASKGDISKVSEIMGGDGDAIPEGFDWHDYAILRVPYEKIPEGWLDPGIVAQAKATLHHSQFLMEYCATFAADSDGFYKRSIIEGATTNKPILTVDGRIQFSAIRHGEANRYYVIGVDPAADRDNAAIVIIEVHLNHRRVVHCWTTNRSKYIKLKKIMERRGDPIADDYYAYIAKKLRSFMRVFNVERIMMDKHGGGSAIEEALGSKRTCEDKELPVYPIIDPDDPKPSDMENGIHILQLVAPNQELNSEANHGMLKDLQDRTLLFPLFDTIEIEKSIEIDKMNKIEFDTYEDLVHEIEELKNEMTTITVIPSATLGRETFDTPEIKGEGHRKGRLRKDRFSALLYANYYARNRDKKTAIILEYKAVGGTRDTMTKTVKHDEPMYHGNGLLRLAGNNSWNTKHGGIVIRRK